MLSNLKAEMARYRVSILDVAKAIGKTDRGARDKVDGKTEFTFREAEAVRDKFFSGNTLEYLFAEAGDTAENGQ